MDSTLDLRLHGTEAFMVPKGTQIGKTTLKLMKMTISSHMNQKFLHESNGQILKKTGIFSNENKMKTHRVKQGTRNTS